MEDMGLDGLLGEQMLGEDPRQQRLIDSARRRCSSDSSSAVR
jgi:hypothetical protein